MSYRRMTFQERMIIFRMYHIDHLSRTSISDRLDRSPSFISREIELGMDAGSYNPFIAEYYHLKKRRYQCPKFKIDEEPWKQIKPKLELRWSPNQIAEWLNREYPTHSMSGKTIYNYCSEISKEKNFLRDFFRKP